MVVTFGTYDLFHRGPLRILRQAKRFGDKLVVGVSTDRLKKGLLPTIPEYHRLSVMSALKDVDAVFSEESFEDKRRYFLGIGADSLVMGDDHRAASIISVISVK